MTRPVASPLPPHPPSHQQPLAPRPPRGSARWPAWSLIGCLAVASVAWGDTPTIERGFKPERVFEVGDIDRVGLFNGGLTLSIPIGQRYAIGLDSELTYGLTLTYSNQVWDYTQRSTSPPPPSQPQTYTVASPGSVFNAGLGWRLSLGELRLGSPNPCGTTNCYIGPDGAQYDLFDRLHPDVADDSTDTFYSADSSYLRLRKTAREVDFPNGQIHRFDTQGRLTQIRDRHGNAINVTYTANSWTINDGVRSHTVNLVDVAHYGKAVGSVALAPFGGGTPATYTFTYEQPQVPRSCLDTDPNTASTMQLPLLVRVELPDGSAYTMPQAQYELAPASGSCDQLDWVPSPQGLLEAVDLPTRGEVRWTYQAFNFPAVVEEEGPQPLYLQKTTGVRTRTLSDATGTVVGTWTYTQSLPGGQNASESITQVSSPLGDRTDHYFKVGSLDGPRYGLPISAAESAPGRTDLLRSTKTYDCDAAGANCVLLRTTYLKYRLDVSTAGVEFNPRVEASYTRFHDDADRWIATDYSSFDGLGHYRTEVISSNFPGAVTRTVHTNYNPGANSYPGTFVMPTTGAAWVLDTYDYAQRQEGSKTFRADFCFDTATGFLQRTRLRRKSDGTISGTDLVKVFTRNAVNQQIVTQHYGGDLVTVGSGALCSLALGTDSFRERKTFQYGSLKVVELLTETDVLVLKTVDRTIDASTGLIASESDLAAVSTSFSYDNMGRLTEERPAEDAWQRYTYTAPLSTNAKVRIRRYANGAFTTLLADQELQFDDFGRVFLERRRAPAGWAKRSTVYNALSQITDVSEWEPDAATHTGWTRYRNFDPFNRPRSIDPPPGSTQRVTLAYSGTRAISRTSKVGTTLTAGAVSLTDVTVTERYDPHGRLYQVVDGASRTTTYAYDPDANLTSVTLGVQSRAFDYDGRGFLISETLPEKGTTGNGAVTYANFDALGNVGRRTDGPMSVDHTYDRAGRLLTTTTPNGTQSLVVFTYGTAIGATDRSRGKIKTAERHNYVTLGGVSSTVVVKEVYFYGGLSGRPSRRTTEVKVDGTVRETFNQTFDSYDALGNLTSLGYPRCTHSGCAAPAARTVTFDYSWGHLSGVPGWATSVTYHPNGMMATVVHDNGVTVTQANDAQARPLPASISTSGALNAGGTAAAEWTSGSYSYDGLGNVIHIGSSRFLYDNLSRLSSASLTTGLNGSAATNRTQTHGFDTWGNRTSTTTQGVTVSSPADSLTNRLTGSIAYDAAGNLTSWNGNSYQYDRLGMMWRMRAGTIESIYLYTADNQRLATFHEGQNRWTWTLRNLDGNVLREYKNQAGTWSVERDYVYRGDKLTGAVTPGGNHYFHLDHLGTPRLITNTARRQVAYHAYYPFGEEATSPTLDSERLKFTAHERDLNATGGTSPAADDLDYMHARFYNPQLGRFLSVDPGRDVEAAAPQSWNLYAYSRNTPLKYVDRDGQVIETAWDAFSIGLGAVSLAQNVRAGNWGSALLDAGGLVLDIAAVAVPGVPGGAGAVIKASRAADTATDLVQAARHAPTEPTTVIGKLKDLGNLRNGERRLQWPDAGSPQANWQQNAELLRREMAKGKPIRDASVDPTTGKLIEHPTSFLSAERNLLRNRGWTYDPATHTWNPPKDLMRSARTADKGFTQ